MVRTGAPSRRSWSANSPDTPEPVAVIALEMLSVLGQRGRPPLVVRLLRLKVVESRPERLARPEADRP